MSICLSFEVRTTIKSLPGLIVMYIIKIVYSKELSATLQFTVQVAALTQLLNNRKLRPDLLHDSPTQMCIR